MIYTIGDSHANIPWKLIPNVRSIWLGAVLAYNIQDKLKDLNNIKTVDNNFFDINILNSNDYLIFSFGEIDCRNHLHKHTSLNDYKQKIDIIIDNYFDFLKSITGNFKKCVYNVIPPTSFDKNIRIKNIPLSGTDKERKLFVEYFNFKLKYLCELNDYIFIDTYRHYCDENGYLNYYLSDKTIHIGNYTYILNFLKKYLNYA